MPKVSDSHIQNRKEQILRAADVCFLRNGFFNTTIADISGEAGLSTGAVYNYFKGKNDIMLALSRWINKEKEELFSLVERIESAREALLKVINYFLSIYSVWAAKYYGHIDLELYVESLRDERIRDVYKKSHARFLEVFETIIEKGQKAGEIRSDVDRKLIALHILVFMIGAVMKIRINPEQDENELLKSASDTLLKNIWTKP